MQRLIETELLKIAFLLMPLCWMSHVSQGTGQEPAEEEAVEEVVPDKPAQDMDVKELMQAAYTRSKGAKSAEDYSAIVDLCNAGLEKGANEAGDKYFKTLSSWAYNRRGQKYSELAAGAAEVRLSDMYEAKALADFEKAVERDPSRWRAIHNRGVSYALVGMYDEAMKDFNRTIELNPRYGSAWFNRGEIYFQQNKFDEAIRDYTTALNINRQDAEAVTSRAHANYQKKLFREALQDFNRAVQLRPDSAKPLTDRGDAYASLGYFEQALRDYQAALAKQEDFGRAHVGAAWVMATSPVASLRNAEGALKHAQRAIELDGEKDFRYLDALAAAQAIAGDFDKAKATIAQALDAAPEPQKAALMARQKLYEQDQPYRDQPRR